MVTGIIIGILLSMVLLATGFYAGIKYQKLTTKDSVKDDITKQFRNSKGLLSMKKYKGAV